MAEAEKQAEGKWYRVCLNTIVRKDMQLDSERLRILPMGSRVSVIETSKENTRRVKINSPIEGWCSMSSSNGDTILAPIEKQDDAAVGGVASTPKSISSKLDHFRNANNNRKKMIENPKLNLSKENKAELEQRINYDAERLNEVETRLEEHDDLKISQRAKYGLHETVRYRNTGEANAGQVGVVRWVGKNQGVKGIPDDDNTIYLVEVAYNAGDCNGTILWKDGTSEQVVKLASAKSGTVISEKQIAGTINSLSLLEKLEELITEVGALRKLKENVDKHNAENPKMAIQLPQLFDQAEQKEKVES